MTASGVDFFISPYPKLPLFGVHCPSINTIHDVLDITYDQYASRFRTRFDKFRLISGLKKAALKWFVSEWSLRETEKFVNFSIKNARVRYNGIDENFTPRKLENENYILNKYQLEPGYIFVLGNGRPHKNLGVLLEISHKVNRKFVFAGVDYKNQQFWKMKYSDTDVTWINNLSQTELPKIYRNAFCVAQPSYIEGYGYPPLEAMACGVPAVVSDIPVLVETTGGNAGIASPYNSKEWLEAFSILEDTNSYRAQREKGLTWIKTLQGRTGWKNHVADVEALLKKDK
ncbi:glycosyltransferase family 4 protein [Thermodesulfobacteriota bacterium]